MTASKAKSDRKTVKTKHIQDFGGIMAIIVDNIAWESVEREVMATDGTDVGITIPSFLIDYFEGEQLNGLQNPSAPAPKSRTRESLWWLSQRVLHVSATNAPVHIWFR